jgi:hypothetical protein
LIISPERYSSDLNSWIDPPILVLQLRSKLNDFILDIFQDAIAENDIVNATAIFNAVISLFENASPPALDDLLPLTENICSITPPPSVDLCKFAEALAKQLRHLQSVHASQDFKPFISKTRKNFMKFLTAVSRDDHYQTALFESAAFSQALVFALFEHSMLPTVAEILQPGLLVVPDESDDFHSCVPLYESLFRLFSGNFDESLPNFDEFQMVNAYRSKSSLDAILATLLSHGILRAIARLPFVPLIDVILDLFATLSRENAGAQIAIDREHCFSDISQLFRRFTPKQSTVDRLFRLAFESDTTDGPIRNHFGFAFLFDSVSQLKSVSDFLLEFHNSQPINAVLMFAAGIPDRLLDFPQFFPLFSHIARYAFGPSA